MENNIYYIITSIIWIYLLVYILMYKFYIKKVNKIEKKIITTFFAKVSKIPGLVEVMRPYVADESAFTDLIKLHTSVMIRKYDTIYILLEHNAKIHWEFTFLMKLSMQIPDLQKNEQFLYIREFIIKYEKYIKNNFQSYNENVEKWNKFIFIKNLTIIGLILPWRKKELI